MVIQTLHSGGGLSVSSTILGVGVVLTGSGWVPLPVTLNGGLIVLVPVTNGFGFEVVCDVVSVSPQQSPHCKLDL